MHLLYVGLVYRILGLEVKFYNILFQKGIVYGLLCSYYKNLNILMWENKIPQNNNLSSFLNELLLLINLF